MKRTNLPKIVPVVWLSSRQSEHQSSEVRGGRPTLCNQTDKYRYKYAQNTNRSQTKVRNYFAISFWSGTMNNRIGLLFRIRFAVWAAVAGLGDFRFSCQAQSQVLESGFGLLFTYYTWIELYPKMEDKRYELRSKISIKQALHYWGQSWVSYSLPDPGRQFPPKIVSIQYPSHYWSGCNNQSLLPPLPLQLTFDEWELGCIGTDLLLWQ